MGEQYTPKSSSKEAKRRRAVIKAARRIVAMNRVTVCAMDSSLGYRGPKCPTVNCYMRDAKTGACFATNAEAARASSKLQRDTITVVEIIDAARNAPEWAKFTMITSIDEHMMDFVREAGIDAHKLQHVLDHNAMYASTMATVFRSQAT